MSTGLYTPPTAVITDCQAHKETADNPEYVVVKAASGAKLSLDEVQQLDESVSPAVAAWRSKILHKFGGPHLPPSTTLKDTPPSLPPSGVCFSGTIAKIDEDHRLVFGWMSVIEENGEPIIDKQDDIIDEPDLESAVYDMVLSGRVDGDTMHNRETKTKLVESMVFTREKQNLLNIDLGKTGWWAGYKVLDNDAWGDVKDGRYKAFSIEAIAERVETT